MRCQGLLSLLLLVAACSRAYSTPSQDESAAANNSPAGGSVNSGDMGMAGESMPTTGAGDMAVSGTTAQGGSNMAGAVAGSDSSDGVELWVGELWSFYPLLCDPDVSWSDQMVVTTGYTETVALVLMPGDDFEHPEGFIVFGDAPAPQIPWPPPETDSDSGSSWLCVTQVPTKGGKYTLLQALRTDQRLSFSVLPSEVLAPDCLEQGPQCSQCTNNSACSLTNVHWPVDLVESNGQLQGTIPGGGITSNSELRLQRCVQDCDKTLVR